MLPSCHGEHVSRLPAEAVVGGSSKRTPHEIWTIGSRVLCIQAHPEFNAALIEAVIVNKMYDNGKLDDVQKHDCVARLHATTLVSTRNTMNSFVFNFLHS